MIFSRNAGVRSVEQKAEDMRAGVDGGISGGRGTGDTIGGGRVSEWTPSGTAHRCLATARVCRLCQVSDEFHDRTSSNYSAQRLRQYTCQR